MARQMEGDDNVLRTKILQEINEDFHQGDKLNLALETSEILNELINCFQEDDNVIRELSSRAIIKVAGSEKGRAILVEDEMVTSIRQLFDDEVKQIRANAFKAIINLAEFTYGIDQVIQFNIISVLIDQLVKEQDQDILILILELLKILNEGEAASVVVQGTDALKHLNMHLKSTH